MIKLNSSCCWVLVLQLEVLPRSGYLLCDSRGLLSSLSLSELANISSYKGLVLRTLLRNTLIQT